MTHNPTLDQATAMMVAATFVEQDEHYDFLQTEAFGCLTLGGCPLAWIAYAVGLRDDADACEWLGYDDLGDFFEDMDRVTGERLWQRKPTLAATGLRRLAREMAQ